MPGIVLAMQNTPTIDVIISLHVKCQLGITPQLSEALTRQIQHMRTTRRSCCRVAGDARISLFQFLNEA